MLFPVTEVPTTFLTMDTDEHQARSSSQINANLKMVTTDALKQIN